MMPIQRPQSASRNGALLLIALCGLAAGSSISAQEIDPRIKEAEARRLASINKVRPAVVAVFDRAGQGGGSGVLIDADGFALTNFHVVQPCGPFMQCGLADGVLYDAVVVGLDPVGDVALIKLLPKAPGKPFPFAPLGDSDLVKVGDWALAMGNPFLLATDFTPTITFGIVSGAHRYQHPAGVFLEYTDCLQTEASINPGNSGGPLFNLQGELIGINGRGSFEKRGRVNSGVGYAISINQIKNFLGHLRGGLLVDHASLGAIVKTDEEGRLSVTQILESSDAYRRGLRAGDDLLAFADRPLATVNQFKNVLGIYPKGWRLPLVFRHYAEDGPGSVRREALVRLMGVQRLELDEMNRPRPGAPPRPGGPPGPPAPGPRPGPRPQPSPPAPRPRPAEELPPDHPSRKFYIEKPGYANFYFNQREQERVWGPYRKQLPEIPTAWTLAGQALRPEKNELTLQLEDQVVTLTLGADRFAVEPLKAGEAAENLAAPPKSGGLLMALHHWRRLFTLGAKGFEAGFSYGGVEPFYPTGWPASRAQADVLLTEHAAVNCKWFFSRQDGTLLGMECWLEPDADPCEVTFGDYREAEGRKRPHLLEVRHGDREYAVLAIKTYQP
jgi:serine protease Do